MHDPLGRAKPYLETTIEDMRVDIDLEIISEKALRAQTDHYMERLEGLRAEAHGIFADQVVALSTRHSEVAPPGYGLCHKW